MSGNKQSEDPDNGKDYSNLVPTMTVGWDALPSFNTEPGVHVTGAAATDVADSGPIGFDASAVRATENTLLAQGRNAVSDYEALRQRVDAAVHSQFWGPPHMDATDSFSQHPGAGYDPPPRNINRDDNNTLADIGNEFAGHINPAMQKGLAMLSNSLELLGNYIAMINSAGESYAHLDRAARFPDPPGRVTINQKDS